MIKNSVPTRENLSVQMRSTLKYFKFIIVEFKQIIIIITGEKNV
jgi:hypothetical protein